MATKPQAVPQKQAGAAHPDPELQRQALAQLVVFGERILKDRQADTEALVRSLREIAQGKIPVLEGQVREGHARVTSYAEAVARHTAQAPRPAVKTPGGAFATKEEGEIIKRLIKQERFDVDMLTARFPHVRRTTLAAYVANHGPKSKSRR